MLLGELRDYKNQMMHDIVETPGIVELIKDAEESVDPYKLPYTHVFPYEYIPGTVDEGKTFICFDVDINYSYSAQTKTYYNLLIRIWVFTHESKLRLDKEYGGGVRIDEILSRLDNVLNGSRYYGLGELELYSLGRFAPTMDFQGKVITYIARDFNRPHKSNKQTVPTNRKTAMKPNE